MDEKADKPLSWTLSTSADKTKLIVDITFHNKMGQKVYLADKLVTSAGGAKLTRSDRLTVMTSKDPSVARMILGVTSSDRPSTAVYEPTYEAVPPDASVKRHFELPLPLQSWHPVGGAKPLAPETTSATLTVQGFTGEPSRWIDRPTDDAEPIRAPELTQARVIFDVGPTLLPIAP